MKLIHKSDNTVCAKIEHCKQTKSRNRYIEKSTKTPGLIRASGLKLNTSTYFSV